MRVGRLKLPALYEAKYYMSVDYKTKKEYDRELFLGEITEQVTHKGEDYFEGRVSLAQTLDDLEAIGLIPKHRKDVEGQFLGNNSMSDSITDYIKDRMDLEPELSEHYIHN